MLIPFSFKHLLALSALSLCGIFSANAQSVNIAQLNQIEPALNSHLPKALVPTHTPITLTPQTFVFTGDLFLGNDKTMINAQTFGSAYNWFSENGTVAVFNLEQTLGNVSKRAGKCTPGESNMCFLFNSPVNNFERFLALKPANSIWVFNQANNHSMDYGLAAQYETYQTVEKYQSSYSVGTLYSPFQIIYSQSQRYAIIGASPHLHTNPIDDTLIEQVANFKRQDITPIVTLHMGAEGEQEHYVRDKDEIFGGRNRGNIYELGRRLIDAGALAVIGHGPHVVRPIQYYKNGVIAYSLGNFMAPHGFMVAGRSGQGAVLRLTLLKDKIVGLQSRAFLHTRHYNRKLYSQGVLLEENTKWVNNVVASGELKKGEAYCASFNNERCEPRK